MTGEGALARLSQDQLLTARLDIAVRRIMRPGVVSIAEDASLRQVQRTMLSHGVHAVLVTAAAGGRPLGWITSRGVLDHLVEDATRVTAGGAITGPHHSR